MSIASYKNILFFDYENAGKVDLSAIPADVFVPFLERTRIGGLHLLRLGVVLGERNFHKTDHKRSP